MAEELTTYLAYVDKDKRKFVTVAGALQGVNKPDFYLGDFFILQLDVRNSEKEAFEFPSDALFFASLNDSLGQNDPDEAATTATDWNQVGQRDDLNLAEGKISCVMNAASPGMITHLGTKDSAKVWLEIWWKVPTGQWSKFLHEKLTIHNSGSDFTPVEVPDIEYATTDDLNAKQDALARVADYASLPGSPADLLEVFVTSVSSRVMWDADQGAWIYSGTGAVFSAADEA